MPPVPLAQRLARIAVGLTALTDATEIRARAVAGASQVCGMSSALLSEPDPDGCWVVTAAAGPLAASLAGWTDEDHRVVAAWVQAGTSSHFPGGIDVPPGYEFLLRTGVRSLAVQPLVVAGIVTGLLVTADTHAVAHDPTVGAALELLAAQTAASLSNAEAMAQLSRRAEQDPLTGLRNAASFVEDLDAAGDRTACLLVDVDHFKTVNDTYGHVAGTACCARSPRSCGLTCGTTRSSTAWAATSWPCCCTPTSTRRQWSRSACSSPRGGSAPPSPSGSRSSPAARRPWPACGPTARSTWPRPRAGTGTWQPQTGKGPRPTARRCRTARRTTGSRARRRPRRAAASRSA